jgi:hypothetical protein
MAFTRLDTDDFVVSADSISATLWSGGQPSLSTFFTSSTQAAGSSGLYYLNVYQTSSTDENAAIQFAIAYGNSAGSGSGNYNSGVDGKSPTSTIYGQYQNLVLGDENTDFVFGNITSSEFFAMPIERARYKEKLFLQSTALSITNGSNRITLTDDSAYVSSVRFTEAGRVFQLISGSQGVRTSSPKDGEGSGWTAASGSYGWLLPDIGTILLNPLALTASAADGGLALDFSGSWAEGSLAYDSTTNANATLYSAISASAAESPSTPFFLNSEETITSDFIFVRPRSSAYNYSENPSFISGSTGEIVFDSFINNPQTFITTVGLYNDTNELLAVAKLSRPLVKDFTKEALIRVKLDF